MIRYLLDTNCVSDLVSHPIGSTAQRVVLVGEASVATSIVVACELRFGAARKGSPRLTRQLDLVLSGLPVLPFEEPADAVYRDLRAWLESRGMVIGALDLLNAAHALSLGLILVTHNTREFARIPSLKVEDWLA